MCVSGNASENLRYIGTHIFFNYFFLGNKILLCILKGIWKMKKVNKQCLLDTPRTVRVSEKTWQVIVRTRRP